MLGLEGAIVQPRMVARVPSGLPTPWLCTRGSKVVKGSRWLERIVNKKFQCKLTNTRGNYLVTQQSLNSHYFS